MKYLIPIFVLIFFTFPLIVEAQFPFTSRCGFLLSEYPESYKLCRLIEDIRDVIYIIGFAMAVIIIMIGGIQYMTAGGDEGRVGKAKKTLTYGLIGVAIILAAGFLIGLVEEIIIGRFGGQAPY